MPAFPANIKLFTRLCSTPQHETTLDVRPCCCAWDVRCVGRCRGVRLRCYCRRACLSGKALRRRGVRRAASRRRVVGIACPTGVPLTPGCLTGRLCGRAIVSDIFSIFT